jgi:hypothetical protein
MTLKLGILALTTFAGFVSGCAASPPPKNPPAQVQLNFNFTPQGQTSLPKSLARGAISGVAQHVGFYYAVNPDCTSDGFVQTQVKTAPAHGAVAFVKADGYTNFPSSSPGHECNRNKSPGIEVVYTSAKDFVGTDQFAVLGIGPKGRYMETEYTVKVIAPP